MSSASCSSSYPSPLYSLTPLRLYLLLLLLLFIPANAQTEMSYVSNIPVYSPPEE